MDLNQLKVRLTSELTRNPKKTAILGVVTLVAVVFWAPLIRDMFEGSEEFELPENVISQSLNSSQGPRQKMSPPHAARHWHELLDDIRESQWTRPTPDLATLPNPFAARASQQAVIEEEDVEPAQPVASVERTPEELGLTLSGAILGPKANVATINGRRFREGSSLATTFQGQLVEEEQADLVFVLRRVRSGHVELARSGKVYHLPLRGRAPQTTLTPIHPPTRDGDLSP